MGVILFEMLCGDSLDGGHEGFERRFVIEALRQRSTKLRKHHQTTAQPQRHVDGVVPPRKLKFTFSSAAGSRADDAVEKLQTCWERIERHDPEVSV